MKKIKKDEKKAIELIEKLAEPMEMIDGIISEIEKFGLTFFKKKERYIDPLHKIRQYYHKFEKNYEYFRTNIFHQIVNNGERIFKRRKTIRKKIKIIE